MISFLVENASQDAVDFDFSNLYISNIKIKNASNDCLDLSAGSYYINKGEFSIVEIKEFLLEKNHIKISNISV